mmetsp:Transcript_18828/g.49733  ORF Transcript_18828/g.49733 Transcript_18828/m.49733 type:complete len:301 (+) Transcript_18828:288-1190(+)
MVALRRYRSSKLAQPSLHRREELACLSRRSRRLPWEALDALHLRLVQRRLVEAVLHVLPSRQLLAVAIDNLPQLVSPRALARVCVAPAATCDPHTVCGAIPIVAILLDHHVASRDPDAVEQVKGDGSHGVVLVEFDAQYGANQCVPEPLDQEVLEPTVFGAVPRPTVRPSHGQANRSLLWVEGPVHESGQALWGRVAVHPEDSPQRLRQVLGLGLRSPGAHHLGLAVVHVQQLHGVVVPTTLAEPVQESGSGHGGGDQRLPVRAAPAGLERVVGRRRLRAIEPTTLDVDVFEPQGLAPRR